jgi:hypothetical protein
LFETKHVDRIRIRPTAGHPEEVEHTRLDAFCPYGEQVHGPNCFGATRPFTCLVREVLDTIEEIGTLGGT